MTSNEPILSVQIAQAAVTIAGITVAMKLSP